MSSIVYAREENAAAGSGIVDMAAGTTYVLDLESVAFDAFLRLEAADGKLLAEIPASSSRRRPAAHSGRRRVIRAARGRALYAAHAGIPRE